MQKNQKGTVVYPISSLDTDVKQVFFVCPEWRKTIKACGKNRENKLKAERRNKTWRMHGDVTLTNETVKFNYDRGRKFTVDAMAAEASMARYQIQYRMEFFQTR